MFARLRQDALWIFAAALAGLLVGYYLPFIAGTRSYYQSDLTYYFQPFTRFIADGLRHGRLPLWNPYLYCGMSQLAVPSPGMLYPFILLFVLFSFSRALALYMVAHQWIAGIGAFILAETLGLGLLGSVVAGLSLALCGYMFSLQANFTLVATIAWLPLLLTLLFRLTEEFERKNIVRFGGAALAMAFMVGAGRPELSVPASLVAVFFIACASCNELCCGIAHRMLVRRIALRLAAMLMGGLLAMPIILPALEWAKLSPRAGGLELKWVLLWSANWYDCLCMICQQPVGDLTILGARFLNLVAARPNAVPFLQSAYISPIVLTFGLWSLLSKSWKLNACLLAVLIPSLIMALGNNTPLTPFVLSLSPFLATFRYPVKLLIFPAIAMAFLAARGGCLASNREVTRAGLWCATGLWTLMGALGGAFLAFPQLTNLYCACRHFSPRVISEFQAAQRLFGESLLVAACLGMATVAIYFLYAKRRLSLAIFETVVACFLAAVLIYPAFHFLRHSTVENFYDQPVELAPSIKADFEAAQQLPGAQIQARALTLYFDPLTPADTFLKRHHIGFQDGFFLYARSMMLPNNNVDVALPYAFGYEAAEVGKYKTWFSSSITGFEKNPSACVRIARFCNLTGVRTVLTQIYRHTPTNLVPLLDSRYFRLRHAYQDLNVREYAPLAQMPRAYFAQQIRKCTWQEFLNKMLDRKSTQISCPTFVEAMPESAQNSGVTANEVKEIRFDADQPEHVSLTTDCSRAGLLVLSDQYYPGWTATVDGAPAKIYRANFFARALWLSPGRHHIEYRYAPDSLRYGMYAFALAFVGYLLMLLFSRRKSPVEARIAEQPKELPAREHAS